ncbi:MAG: hypothetical protein KDB14_16585 [Planctomycetales bacterium]|nr:hypothetical protein [Planctomycetales bacterium]
MSISPSIASLILIGKLWLLMYGLVILCVALGVLVIARPSKRKPYREPE